MEGFLNQYDFITRNYTLSASPTRPVDGVRGGFEEPRVIGHEDRRKATMLASCERNANRLPRGIPD